VLLPSKGANVQNETYKIPVRLSLVHAKAGAPTLQRGVLYFVTPDNDNGAAAAGGNNNVKQEDNQQDDDDHHHHPQQYSTPMVPERTVDGDLRIGDTQKIMGFVRLVDPTSGENTDGDDDGGDIVYSLAETTPAIRYGQVRKLKKNSRCTGVYIA
jgi:hypothetical protein